MSSIASLYPACCAVFSRSVMSNSLQAPGLWPSRLLCSWGFSRQEHWSGFHALLQGIFPTQGLNPGLPHCRQILNHLTYWGSPRTVEWAAYPFSRGTSQPRNGTGVSCIAGSFFISSDAYLVLWSNNQVTSLSPL